MGKIHLVHGYQNIISIENLLEAWREFLRGKRNKKDVQKFQLCLMDNILDLHADLKNKTYCHGGYHAFNISDPKQRHIHKAIVRDRLLHHAIYRKLYPFFDTKFIADSYSCRKDKGTHKALERFRSCIYKVSRNNARTAWVLKCDIRKFFASIDHATLFRILRRYISDEDILWLVERVVSSFDSGVAGKGLPLGNLTSQLLVNIYMNGFDQFVKQTLKAKHYIRYADDFVVLHHDKNHLLDVVKEISRYLSGHLALSLHPDKTYIKSVNSGIDFLGWVHFFDHRVLRTATRRRMFKKLGQDTVQPESIQSYLGLLQHGNTWNILQKF